MKVTIKEFNVDMEVKNNGIEFEVRSPNGEEFHGDLVVTKTGLVWCKGKTSVANGVKINWADFMKWAEAQK